MEILEYKNARWADEAQTAILVDVLFEGFEDYIPYCSMEIDDVPHGVELWGTLQKQRDVIGPYVNPVTPEAIIANEELEFDYKLIQLVGDSLQAKIEFLMTHRHGSDIAERMLKKYQDEHDELLGSLV